MKRLACDLPGSPRSCLSWEGWVSSGLDDPGLPSGTPFASLLSVTSDLPFGLTFCKLLNAICGTRISRLWRPP